MSPELLFNIVVFTGAVITILIARARFGTWLTTGLLYSAGWIGTVVFYQYLNLVLPEGYESPFLRLSSGLSWFFGGMWGSS